MESEYVATDLPRNTQGAPCICGGFADRQDESPTPDEIRRHDCGRSYACCTGVFKCRVCGLRFIGAFEAPEMDDE